METLAHKMTLAITTYTKFRIKGFTLIELLIVMAILAAMITVAAPYAKNSNKKTIAVNEALNIKELIYYAIDKSKSSNSAVRFVHSESDRSYWLEISDLTDHYQFKKLDNSFGTVHYFNNAIQSISTEIKHTTDASQIINGSKHITFDPRQELPSGVSIRIDTLYCWVKLTINKRNIEISNGNF